MVRNCGFQKKQKETAVQLKKLKNRLEKVSKNLKICNNIFTTSYPFQSSSCSSSFWSTADKAADRHSSLKVNENQKSTRNLPQKPRLHLLGLYCTVCTYVHCTVHYNRWNFINKYVSSYYVRISAFSMINFVCQTLVELRGQLISKLDSSRLKADLK